MRPFARILAAAASLLLLGGCAHQTPAPKSVIELRLSAAHRDMRGALNVGQGLRVVLPRAVAPDTQWVLLTNENRVLQQRSALQPTPEGGAAMVFQAVHLGRTVMRFAATNPAASEAHPTDLFQITVDVDEP